MRSAHDVRSGQRQVDTHGGALALDACQFDGAAATAPPRGASESCVASRFSGAA